MDSEKEYYALVKKAFDRLAPVYDLFVTPIWGIREKVVNAAHVKSDSKILDVATGTGQQAFAFAKTGCQVVGIDLSEAMLNVARKKNKHRNVSFEFADATNLCFEESTFDVACVSFALHDMPVAIREKVLQEMVRVTTPQGQIVIVDYALPLNKIGRFLIYRLIRLYEGPYYGTFIKSDFGTLLKKVGIEIKQELPVLLGAGRILIGNRV